MICVRISTLHLVLIYNVSQSINSLVHLYFYSSEQDSNCRPLLSISGLNYWNKVHDLTATTARYFKTSLYTFFECQWKWDRLKVPILRHRGKLISTCCGTLRQPRYRLQIGFPSSRDPWGYLCQSRQPRGSRQPREFSTVFLSLLGLVCALHCFRS